MTQHKFQISALAAVLALLFAPFALAADKTTAATPHSVAGEKLDSGLGELPHYSQWAKDSQLAVLVAAASHVPGESLDSGLGELPHYSQWADTSGRPRLDIASRR